MTCNKYVLCFLCVIQQEFLHPNADVFQRLVCYTKSSFSNMGFHSARKYYSVFDVNNPPPPPSAHQTTRLIFG
jgi:hypothetical protein